MLEQITGILIFIGAFGTACIMLDKYMLFRMNAHIKRSNEEQAEQSKKVSEEIVKNVNEQFAKFEHNIGQRLTDFEKNQLLTFSKLAQHDEELKYLNKRSENIKTDAEIREIAKRG